MEIKQSITTHYDAVIHFIKKMDADMVSTLLNSKYTFQEFPKEVFIRKLGDLFFEFSQLGDMILHSEKGACYGCSKGKKGLTFIGNKSKCYINFVIDTDNNDHVIDVYECDEFCTTNNNYRKKRRLYLDNSGVYDNNNFDEGVDDDDPFFNDNDRLY
ncbi:MAG: hypothetical protein V3V14_07005 [Saprospiraceae bacterium]